MPFIVGPAGSLVGPNGGTVGPTETGVVGPVTATLTLPFDVGVPGVVHMVEYGEGCNDEAIHLKLSCSDDNSAWTDVADWQLSDYPGPEQPFAIDGQHRYVRFTYFNHTKPGLNYFSGITMTGVLMWAMSGDEPVYRMRGSGVVGS